MNPPQPDEFADQKRLLKHITQNLEAAYGLPREDGFDDPLSGLVMGT